MLISESKYASRTAPTNCEAGREIEHKKRQETEERIHTVAKDVEKGAGEYTLY